MASPVTEAEQSAAPTAAKPTPADQAGELALSSRLAPPLPPPAPEPTVLTGALAVLALAAAVVGVAVARRQRRCRRRPSPRATALTGLEVLRREPDVRRQADQTRRLLTAFLQGETGTPCSALTVQELTARLSTQPTAQQPALGALLAVLERCDAARFLPAKDAAGAGLPEAAICAVRLWRAEAPAAAAAREAL